MKIIKFARIVISFSVLICVLSLSACYHSGKMVVTGNKKAPPMGEVNIQTKSSIKKKKQ